MSDPATNPPREVTGPVPPRVLGRTDRAVSPIWWRLDARPIESVADRVLQAIGQSGTRWFVLPADLPIDVIARWQPALRALGEAHLVVGIRASDLNTRTMKPVYERLDALGGLCCEGLLLESLSLSEVKAGRPFHRFSRLRDEGRAAYCLAGAPDFASAEWMIEHTPAHAIVASFGLEDPTLRYRVTDSARDLGTAIVACRPQTTIWVPPQPVTAPASISFALAHPAVAAVIEDLPYDQATLQRYLAASMQPMDPPAVAEWWGAFEPQVPAPAKPRGGHPPEFGA